MSNCFSMILGFGLCLTALHILEHTDNGTNPLDNIIRLKVEGILMVSAMFWLSIIFITCLVLKDPKYRMLNITIVGSFCCICSLVFYAAPLSNVKEIIRKKDSASLYAPAIFINLISCILWFFYGLYGIFQKIVWVPNCIGIAVCIFELYICWYYPPQPIKSFGGVVVDDYRHNNFAVYSSSRQMSLSANNFPPLISLANMNIGSRRFNSDDIDDKNENNDDNGSLISNFRAIFQNSKRSNVSNKSNKNNDSNNSIKKMNENDMNKGPPSPSKKKFANTLGYIEEEEETGDCNTCLSSPGEIEAGNIASVPPEDSMVGISGDEFSTV